MKLIKSFFPSLATKTKTARGAKAKQVETISALDDQETPRLNSN